ncbi:hypothetical protein BKA70DRAFT_1343023, partial [Coprinopsis sp. MPI-PUGE-AT-0042]
MKPLPDLSHLFASNAPLKSFETAIIEHVVELMDLKILKLQQELATAQAERERCRSLLSPLRRLPAEILGEIFACVSVSQTTEAWLEGELLGLCLVCRGWRDAAYATHRLWTSIYIDTSTWRNWRRRAKWCMERSVAVPKSLTIYSPEDSCRRSPPSSSNSMTMGPIIHTLSISCHASRCIHRLYKAMRSLKQPSPCPWDGISCLEVQVRERWDEVKDEDSDSDDNDLALNSDVDASKSFFMYLPPVSAFRLDVPYQRGFPDLIPTLQPFLSRLTTLRIDCNWDGDAVVRILRCYHQGNLEELAFGCKSSCMEHFTTWTGDPSWLKEIVLDERKQFVLPNLRILRFYDLDPYAFKIIHFFQAPSLTELHLGFPT